MASGSAVPICAGLTPLVPARWDAVVASKLCTQIANDDGVQVSTIEHLMAALAGLAINNALIEIDGPEVPIMDGSSLPFVQILDQAGFRRQGTPQMAIEILKPIEVVEDDKSASLVPCDRFEVRFEIDFPNSPIGHQAVDLVITEDTFRTELSAARTFGFLQGVEALRAAGLARGGSLDNAVVIDGDTILNEGGLRFADEFVRHKALDAIGDLYLVGHPLLASYAAHKSGHALNNVLLRALLDQPQSWEYTSFSQRREAPRLFERDWVGA
jgi:UDP-3-O-[3-hydroxymyristoyl] N-acetylglucosamine deacetylase